MWRVIHLCPPAPRIILFLNNILYFENFIHIYSVFWSWPTFISSLQLSETPPQHPFQLHLLFYFILLFCLILLYPISAACMHLATWVWSHLQSMENLPETTALKKTASPSLSHSSPHFRGGPHEPLPNLCWNVECLDLVLVTMVAKFMSTTTTSCPQGSISQLSSTTPGLYSLSNPFSGKFLESWTWISMSPKSCALSY